MGTAGILVVEDEGVTAKDIESRLTRLGYHVPAVCFSGEEAIEKAAATRPDLVLMDIKLKGRIDGVEAAACLRERFGIPVTYLTAFADDATLARARATGPYGYVVKPFDERELHATIQVALERRRLEAIHNSFVSTMTHELRVSLGTVIGYTDLLLNGDFGAISPDARGALRTIARKGWESIQLMRAALDISRRQSRHVPLDIEEIPLAALATEIVTEAHVRIDKPGVDVVCDVPADLAPLRSDRLKVEMVLTNLVGNAIKFTDEGRVAVGASPVAGGVELSVSDTGRGIPAHLQTRIFEPFEQGDAGTVRRQGAGLGLYIVRCLLEVLGGTISVESEVGRGSTFRVRLPLEPPGIVRL